MHRKWKKVAALGMAVLLGCLMPMGTMLAAEDDSEVVQEVDADSDTVVVSDAEAISDDNENVDAEETAEEENAGDEADTEVENVGDEVYAEDENVDDEADVDMDGQEGIQLMSATEEPQAGDVEVQEDAAVPVISITLNGENCIDDQGDNINYKYTNNPSSAIGFSASLNDKKIYYCYYLDENPGDKAKDISSINWSEKCSAMDWGISSNKTYVAYVKAEANEQTVYARSCGIVVDTIAPKIGGVEEGNTYQEGTAFTVEDANLDVVMINGSPVTPEQDGSYRVRTEGASCVISAKDKAGNGTTCSITVSREGPAENTVISKSGTYSLKTGTSYRLTAGTWQVNSDSTVYQGGRNFYVTAAGDYSFTKQ